MKIEITVIHSGLLAETFYNGSYYHKLYIGYPKSVVRKLFREYVKEQESKYFYEEKAK